MSKRKQCMKTMAIGIILLFFTPTISFAVKFLPPSIQVGKTCSIALEGQSGATNVKILEIDKKNGWIKIQQGTDTIWFNIDKILFIAE